MLIDEKFMIDLIREAGKQFIMPRWRNLLAHDIVNEDKDVPSKLVTLADVEAEAYMHDRLTQKFPNAVIIGEEAYAATEVSKQEAYLRRLETAKLCFTLDPVDGTNYFRKGDDRFATIIGVWSAGSLEQVFIVRHALNSSVIHAARTHGVTIDAQPVKINPIVPSASMINIFAYPPKTITFEDITNFQPCSLNLSLGLAGEITDHLSNCQASKKPQKQILHIFKSDIHWQGLAPWDYPVALAWLEAGGFSFNASRPDDPYACKGEKFHCVMASHKEFGEQAVNKLLSTVTPHLS